MLKITDLPSSIRIFSEIKISDPSKTRVQGKKGFFLPRRSPSGFNRYHRPNRFPDPPSVYGLMYYFFDFKIKHFKM